jgi:hypothetical protein
MYLLSFDSLQILERRHHHKRNFQGGYSRQVVVLLKRYEDSWELFI